MRTTCANHPNCATAQHNRAMAARTCMAMRGARLDTAATSGGIGHPERWAWSRSGRPRQIMALCATAGLSPYCRTRTCRPGLTSHSSTRLAHARIPGPPDGQGTSTRFAAASWCCLRERTALASSMLAHGVRTCSYICPGATAHARFGQAMVGHCTNTASSGSSIKSTARPRIPRPCANPAATMALAHALAGEPATTMRSGVARAVCGRASCANAVMGRVGALARRMALSWRRSLPAVGWVTPSQTDASRTVMRAGGDVANMDAPRIEAVRKAAAR